EIRRVRCRSAGRAPRSHATATAGAVSAPREGSRGGAYEYRIREPRIPRRSDDTAPAGRVHCRGTRVGAFASQTLDDGGCGQRATGAHADESTLTVAALQLV